MLIKSSFLLSYFLIGAAYPAAQPVNPIEAEQYSLLKRTPPSSYITIDPKLRAEDYKEAFEILRKEKTTSKVFFQLIDGTTISNIIDMTLMDNASLIIFRFNSQQGIRFQVVRIEDINLINYQ